MSLPQPPSEFLKIKGNNRRIVGIIVELYVAGLMVFIGFKSPSEDPSTMVLVALMYITASLWGWLFSAQTGSPLQLKLHIASSILFTAGTIQILVPESLKSIATAVLITSAIGFGWTFFKSIPDYQKAMADRVANIRRNYFNSEDGL